MPVSINKNTGIQLLDSSLQAAVAFDPAYIAVAIFR